MKPLIQTLALFALSVGSSFAQIDQTCIDNAVIKCFDGCNDADTFQECIIGCATGANNNLQNCFDQCIGDPICLSKCIESVRDISRCAAQYGQITSQCGTVTFNRATGMWQQTIRVSNQSLFANITDIVFVLDDLSASWSITNKDGLTEILIPANSPYKRVGDLGPGESLTITLQFKRLSNTPLTYTPRLLTAVMM